MRIGIEATSLARKNRDGIGQYVWHLTKELIKQDRKNRYTLLFLDYLDKKMDLSGLGFDNRVQMRMIPRLPRKLEKLLLMAGKGRRIDRGIEELDVVIFPDFIAWPVSQKTKRVVVVYDLAFHDRPEFLTAGHRKMLEKLVKSSVMSADRVVTISKFIKRRIHQVYGTPLSKISVISPAVDSTLKPASYQKISSVKKKYGIKGKYLLYLGTLEPRKNIVNIVEAYKLLPKNLKKDLKLILAGGKGWLDKDIHSAVNSLPKNQVRMTGYVDEKDKAALLSGAELFLYPSHYEGWGMQILESMACGTPVITAANSSLTEASQNSAFLIKDSMNSEELSRAITTVLSDRNLKIDLTKRGHDAAKKSSWRKSAQEMIKVLNEL